MSTQFSDSRVTQVIKDPALIDAVTGGRTDRRAVLKAMAMGAAGTIAAAMGVAVTEAATTTEVLAAANSTSTGTAPSVGTVVPPTTAGLTYKYHSGYDFIPRGGTTTYAAGNDNGDRSLTAVADYVPCHLDLPQGSIIKEVKFDIVKAADPNMGFALSRFDPTNFGLTDVNLAFPVVVNSASVQTVVPFTPNLAIDNTQFAYVLYWNPVATDTSHKIVGARVGYVNGIPGIVSFPDPRRVFDGFATPIPRNTIAANIDATTKQAGGASGVPVGARAAYCAVQALNHTVTGPLTLYPTGALDPNIANWVANTVGGLNLSYMMVPLSTAGRFNIHSYIDGNVIVDVWGYLI
jgi:hypothetical protein